MKKFNIRIKKLSLVKKLILLIIIGTVAYIGYSTFFKPTNGSVSYVTAKVEKGPIVSTVSGSGQVSYTNSASVTTQVSGTVTKVFVKNGDEVKAGAPIMEISLDQDSMQKYVQALSAYQSAKNSLANAEASTYSLRSAMIAADDAFLKQALNKGLDSDNSKYKQLKADKSSADAKYANQDNVIAQSKTSLSSASLSLQQASPTVYAPISGTISGLTIQAGTVISQSSVSSSSSQTKSQKLANISTLSAPMITVELTEIDIPKVKTGSKTTVTLDALPDKTYTGKISGIDTTGSVSSGVTTYPVVITLDTISPEIYANMSATANIIIDSRESTLFVPTSAVQFQDGQATVRVLKNNVVEYVTVETGLTTDTSIEILSGVDEGTDVITSISTKNAAPSSSGTSSVFGIRTGGGFSNVRVQGR